MPSFGHHPDPLSFSQSVHPGCGGGLCTNRAQSKCSGLTDWMTGLLSNQLTFPMVLFMFLSCLAPHTSHDISLSKIYSRHASWLWYWRWWHSMLMSPFFGATFESLSDLENALCHRLSSFYFFILPVHHCPLSVCLLPSIPLTTLKSQSREGKVGLGESLGGSFPYLFWFSETPCHLSKVLNEMFFSLPV